MIWVILAALGVPLWLCAIGILSLFLRNRSLRKRGGDIRVRLRMTPEGRWRRGHALWVHDVLSFRASPAGWRELLLWSTGATLRDAAGDDMRGLHRLGDRPVVATLALDGGGAVELAAEADDRDLVLGPHLLDGAAVKVAERPSLAAAASAINHGGGHGP